MSALRALADGGYDFLEGVFPYSQGVIARDGFSLERARFPRPRPLSFAGFGDFNRSYVAVLTEWGLVREGLNPVARSNVAPEISPPAEPSFHAFCYTVPAPRAPRDHVVADSGEWPEGGRFPEDIVARAGAGLAWNYCRPPIEGLDFEMDLRRVTTERLLAP